MEEIKIYYWPNEKKSEEEKGSAFWKLYHKKLGF